MQAECEIIKKKLKAIKDGTAKYEDDDEFRLRLAGYAEEDFIEDMLECRKGLSKVYDRVVGSEQELMDALGVCYNPGLKAVRNSECQIIDFNTRKVRK